MWQLIHVLSIAVTEREVGLFHFPALFSNLISDSPRIY